jgi:hypothetical protein
VRGQKAGDDCTDGRGESLVAIDPQLTPRGLLQRARRLVGLFELVQDLGTALVIFVPTSVRLTRRVVRFSRRTPSAVSSAWT